MRILLAIDGSDDAFHAAEFFCRLPHDESMQIEVLSVVNSPDVSTSTSTRAWLDEYMENLNAAANRAYSDVKKCFEGSVVTLSHHKMSGHVGHQIVDRASEIGAELIVIGARGHSTVARLLLGSVSDYVGRHATCSVLTVRPPMEQQEPTTLRITLCYDGSKPSEKILNQFEKFAWRKGVAVQVLTVVPIFPEFPAESVELLQEQIQHDTSDAEQVAADVAARLSQNGVVAETTVTAAEHVGEAIITAADQHRSDLILIGNTGRSLLPRLLLGSVSSYVVRHAQQSVWLVR